MSDASGVLPVPLGRRVELPGRGTTFVREVEGPAGAPTIVLLHGWIASGGMNWFQVFGPLGRHFRLIAPDLRGHARGVRSRRRFRLADCADDTAAMLDQMGVTSAIVAGYSMGGPVAQLLWKRHRAKVDGLVLCSTSHSFVIGMRPRLVFTTMMAAAAGTTRAGQVATMLPRSLVKQLPWGARPRAGTMREFARAEMRRHDWRLVLEAGDAIGRYDASSWVGDIDVPTAVLITTQDRAIEPGQQAKLASAIPDAAVHRIDDGHLACVSPAYAGPLLRACSDVAAQAYPGFVRDLRRVDG